MTIGALSRRVEISLLGNLFTSNGTTPVAQGGAVDLRLGLWASSPGEEFNSAQSNRTAVEDNKRLTRYPDQVSSSKPNGAPMTFTPPASGICTNAEDVTVTIPAGGIVTHITVEGILETSNGSTVLLYAELTTSTGVSAPVTVPAGGTFRLPAGALTVRLDDGTSAMALSNWAEQAALNWLLRGVAFPSISSHDLRLLTAANPESVADPSGFTQDRTGTDPQSGNPNWSGHTNSTVFNNTALTFSAIPSGSVLTHISVIGQVRGAESSQPTYPQTILTNFFPSTATARQPVIVGGQTALDTNDDEVSYVLLPKAPAGQVNTSSFIQVFFDPITTIPAGVTFIKATLRIRARLVGPAVGITNLHVSVGSISQTPVQQVIPVTSTTYAEYVMGVPITVSTARQVIDGTFQFLNCEIQSADIFNGTVLNDIRITQAQFDIAYANTVPQALANGTLGTQVTTSTGSTVSLTPGAVQITLD